MFIVVDIEKKPKLKSNKGYFLLLYCLVIAYLWPIGLFWIAFNEPYQYIILYTLVMVPQALIAALMVSNFAIIPFKYSIFGPYKRRPFPNEKPLLKKLTSGRISLLNIYGPFIQFIVFPSGLGLSVFDIEKVFIPTHYFVQIDKRFFGSYILKHNSPEVRSPIIFYNKDLYESLQKLKDFEKENM